MMEDLTTAVLADGRRIPTIGLGLWQVSPEDAERAVPEALAAGYRLIDTAAAYGNEAAVGRALAHCGADRSKVFVTSKVWIDKMGRADVVTSCARSVEALGGVPLDLCLIHWPMPQDGQTVEAWQGLIDARSQGLVRSIGVSNYRIDDLELIINETGVTPVVNQVEVHPTFGQPELAAWAAEHGMLLEAWSPLGHGGDLQLAAIGSIAEAHDVSVAQVIIRWHLQHGRVVIPKSVHASRIRQNRDVYGFALTGAEMTAIDQADEGLRFGLDPSTVQPADFDQ